MEESSLGHQIEIPLDLGMKKEHFRRKNAYYALYLFPVTIGLAIQAANVGNYKSVYVQTNFANLYSPEPVRQPVKSYAYSP